MRGNGEKIRYNYQNYMNPKEGWDMGQVVDRLPCKNLSTAPKINK
jgi:hypothetical protein